VKVREIDQAWIYGFYTCVARNEYGIADINIKLERASRYCYLLIEIITLRSYVCTGYLNCNCNTFNCYHVW